MDMVSRISYIASRPWVYCTRRTGTSVNWHHLMWATTRSSDVICSLRRVGRVVRDAFDCHVQAPSGRECSARRPSGKTHTSISLVASAHWQATCTTQVPSIVHTDASWPTRATYVSVKVARWHGELISRTIWACSSSTWIPCVVTRTA